MDVQYLGNCANQTAERETVSLILRNEGERVLVDAGPGVVRQIQRVNESCANLKWIVITHCHGDHVLGLPYVIFNVFYEGLSGIEPPETINIVAGRQDLAGLKQMIRFCYEIDRYSFSVNFIEAEEFFEQPLRAAGCEIRFARVDHTAPTLGLRVDSPHGSIAYSSDTLYCNDFVRLSQGVDLMIHEGMFSNEFRELSGRVRHSTAEMAGRAARDAGAGALSMVHIYPPLIGSEDLLVDEAKSMFSGPVSYAEELAVTRVPL